MSTGWIPRAEVEYGSDMVAVAETVGLEGVEWKQM
jgi:hypothetical protein